MQQDDHEGFGKDEEAEKFFELRKRLRSLALPPAPPELRERVLRAVATERARESSAASDVGPERFLYPSVVRRLAMAAAVAALFVGGWYVAGGPGSSGDLPAPPTARESPAAGQETQARFVEDFVRWAEEEERIVSSDPGEVARFLSEGLGVSVRPRTFQGFELVGAEICVVGDKRGAVIIYRANGQMLHHYVLHHEDAAFRAPTPSDASPLRWSGSTSPSAVIWGTAVREEALVGDLAAADLLDLL